MRVPAVMALVVTALFADAALAKPKEVKLKRRYGGELIAHVNEATRMMQGDTTYRVVGHQYSAAAMQVLFIESQFPDRICATRQAKLYFHLSYNLKTKESLKEPDLLFTRFIRPENLKRLGKLPRYGKGWKIVKASDYLGLCGK